MTRGGEGVGRQERRFLENVPIVFGSPFVDSFNAGKNAIILKIIKITNITKTKL